MLSILQRELPTNIHIAIANNDCFTMKKIKIVLANVITMNRHNDLMKKNNDSNNSNNNKEKDHLKNCIQQQGGGEYNPYI